MQKCIVTYSIIILFISLTSYGQINLGLLGGINNTSFSGDNPKHGSYSRGYGYNFGLTSDIFIADDVAINFQPMFSNYNSFINYEVDYQYEPYDSIKIYTDYFELPINIKVNADNKIAYVTAGVSIGYLLNAGFEDQTTSEEIEVEDSFEVFNLKANFGVGIQFAIGDPILFFELHYSQSITNATKQKIGGLDIDHKLKSNGLKLFTGLNFRL